MDQVRIIESFAVRQLLPHAPRRFCDRQALMLHDRAETLRKPGFLELAALFSRRRCLMGGGACRHGASSRFLYVMALTILRCTVRSDPWNSDPQLQVAG
jgi:hypothetical protein